MLLNCHRVVTALVKYQLAYSHLLPDSVPPGTAHSSGERSRLSHFRLLQSDQDQSKLKVIVNIRAYLIYLHGFGFTSDEQLSLKRTQYFLAST